MMQISTARYEVANDVEASHIARSIVEGANEIAEPTKMNKHAIEHRADIIEGYRKSGANALQYFVDGRDNMTRSDVRQYCARLVEGLNILWNLE